MGGPKRELLSSVVGPGSITVGRCGSNDNAHAIAELCVITADSRKHGPGEQAALCSLGPGPSLVPTPCVALGMPPSPLRLSLLICPGKGLE